MEKKQEIQLIENTLKLLRRGKYELSGEEAIVFHTCFQYLVKRLNDLSRPDIIALPPKQEPLPKIKKVSKDADK